jgi:signal transduction histidine kinase
MAADTPADHGSADLAEAARRSAPDPLRSLIPLFALAIVVLAQVSEPAGLWQFMVMLGVAGLFTWWARWNLPIAVLTVGVLAATIVIQLGPHLETATFFVCLVGIVVTRWSPINAASGIAVLAMAATPVVVATQRPDGYGWPIWLVAVLFTAALGWTLRRQEALATELNQARLELAQATMREERRRIARDVHDLVGHGLAAMMIQVTSARHVLTRDPVEAAEALASAEDIGRQSMQELRRTVALLRSADETGLDAPLPKLSHLGNLVDAARDRGLDVTYHAEGIAETVDPVIGLTLHRITQEALANASRHAPNARTIVTTAITDDAVVLEVDSVGAAFSPADGAPHFGLQGMRERADVVGGEFSAGPSPAGWTVRCRVPRTDET